VIAPILVGVTLTMVSVPAGTFTMGPLRTREPLTLSASFS